MRAGSKEMDNRNKKKGGEGKGRKGKKGRNRSSPDRGLYIQIPELHCIIRQQNDAIWQDKKLHQLNDKAQEYRLLMGN